MLARRALYYAQFGAVPILPLWLLIGRGIVIDGTGWEFVLLLFVCPILLAMFIALATVATTLISDNNDLRRMRNTLDWQD